ncbi:E3 ubiquitin-protein ligase Bre1 isoform X2 [Neodiprion pinetum]|uniref:E3 ubiquitin protein ligase n=1 Tax=Neodiprion lecontei TaxID=441921 RepID=A0A6J0BJL8_NEOLC|nr:E3 ubiquitin-protein ligase Bre1 isoform X2 [Neodiprion lecontei]XP_046426002.1 E3 ubiquitin-protein ligase Bre1 isoform X2 [Neodiprion fabricii]XP_046483824.1 E3 ubiquitin-protein ligase Bre1 isoform X2 [Neodiprion pinetum]XP_046620005.1 E3 ubiquitin-protein ligase Bre1 isoform X2 [Neodiprion virginianus]
MSKRPADSGDSGSQPPIKKVQFEPILIGPISTLEEMDMKVLQFQNKKLAQRLEQRHRMEAELRQRIEQLEKRQTQDDAVLNVVNRYWNQLNEDIRVLLQRFDAETADESENKNESEATTSFLMQLSSWDKEELDDKLANRVQVSKRAVSKVVQAFDRLSQRNEKITLALKGEFEGEEAPNIDDVVKKANAEIQAENRNLQAINIQLHEKYHTISLKMSELQDTITGKDTLAAELRNQVDDLQYELNKVRSRNDKLEHHLGEAIEKLKAFQQIHGSDDKGSNKPSTMVASSVSQTKVEDLQRELEETRELANNRLQELDKLHQQHRDSLKEVEKLKMDIRQLPESVIVETTEYKCLQSQFSVLYNESMQLKTQLDDARQQLQSSKNAHLRHIEMMESEELMAQKKLRGECIQLEDVLAQLRKEYEMLRIEFEQNLAANEQTGPINREMRHLITSLQNHNQQLKGEVHRYKRKYKEASAEIPRLKKEVEEVTTRLGQQTALENKEGSSSDCSGKEEDTSGSLQGSTQIKEESGMAIKRETGADEDVETVDVAEGDASKGTPDSLTLASPTLKKEKDTKREKDVKKETVKTEHREPAHRTKETKIMESELVRDLKAQLKKAVNEMKEMKLLLDMYKGVGKEQRDKVQLMAAERKIRGEVEELRQQIKKIQCTNNQQESKREERKKLADEDAQIKIKKLEEQAYTLQRQVASQKQNCVWLQEEEALLNEMEVTGQAFEDMQEQNSRLIQQLREKDDANFKLMTERIKSNQLHKLAREEKDVLKEQVITLTTQVEAANVVVRKLEEKERLLQNSLATVEKELALRQQAMEMHKRKAIESAQSAADLKLHLEKYHSQMKEAQQVVAEKTSSLEAEAYKTKRLQEEIAQLRRKVERMKKIELAETLDEVMAEELREYKETLTCPSCKVKRKDAVLTKCFHVFCWDCLRTRYETRQRKCPKCNCAFGANDYHRLYLST